MAERIDLPPNLGAHPKRLQEELVPRGHLVDHGLHGGVGLVILNPPAPNKLKLPTSNNFFETLLNIRGLVLPPPRKERQFRPDEPTVRVAPELRQDIRQDPIHVVTKITFERVQPPGVAV